MKIAICDDDKYYVDEIQKNIYEILSENKIKADFSVFSDSYELFNSDTHYDMAFLDIEMSPFTGIQVAEKLKKINPYIVTFIITSYDKYLDDAMDLNVFRYIKKPLDIRRLRNGVNKALDSIDSNIISVFMKSHKSATNILINDIVYIEIVGRTTKVVTINGEYISDKKITFWKEKLIASFFFQVHKSFIINMKHISDYRRDTVVLSEKYNIPISYRKQAEFRSYFLNYFGGR